MPRGFDDAMNRFDFRGIHPLICIGTASDRYAGWLGQVYTPERYPGRITSRPHSVGGKSFTEKLLPVESVVEYFEHFRVLELDFTFYDTLVDAGGNPTRTHRALSAYARHVPGDGALLLKVPQIIFARKIRRQNGYIDNENYLDPGVFMKRFYEPAIELLSHRLSGFIFEQEYQRSADRVSTDAFARSLDQFFSSVPRDGRYHVEIRTGGLLTAPVTDVMKEHGVGQVLSHWTWLPSLNSQFQKGGRRFLNERKDCVIRLMTPGGMRYEQAYAKAHPFDALIPGMMDAGMVSDTAHIMKEGVTKNARVFVIVNNRSGGNAPLIAREIACRYMDDLTVSRTVVV
jgi:uncharacterized protein YecE (DUF72 family)